jgi:hypothetical protein
MDLTHTVDLLSIKKNPLGDRGLSCIDMSHETHVSSSDQPFLSSHLSQFSTIKTVLSLSKAYLGHIKGIS